MTKISRASFLQIKIIQSLAHQIWPTAFADILSREQIAYMLEWMYAPESLKKQIQNGHQFLLIEFENKYAGFCSFEHQKSVTKLHKIYLLPDIQGMGLGMRLLQEVINLAAIKNQQAIQLNVNRYNKAVSFYEKAGFKIIGVEDNPIGNGYFMNDFVMELKLREQ